MKNFANYPAVQFTLKKELYGVAAPFVQHIGAMPEIVEIPNTPSWARGVISFRDGVVPLIDLRLRLGMGSFIDDIKSLVKMMKEREQDHVNWLVELENSVKEGRIFNLGLDPRKCKFGKWYNSYKAKSYSEAQFLKKFAIPHQHIHSIAGHVEELVDKGAKEEALSLIAQTKEGELSEMINLFGQFREIIRDLAHREIVLILNDNGLRKAIAVDTIETVAKLKENSIEEMPAHLRQADNPLVQYIGKKKDSGEVICLLQAEKLLLPDQPTVN